MNNEIMSPFIKRSLRLLRTPAVIVFAICLALFTINLALTHRIRPYNSDDVAYQNIVITWHPFSGKIATLGSSDNFVDKIPVYILFGKLFGESRKVLFVESGIFALLGFTLFYTSSLYFMKKARIALTYRNLLPFLWLASFGHEFSQLYLNPSWRGFETGLSFAVLVLVAMLFYREIDPLKSWRTKLVTVFATLGIGIIIYSDPYFVYFTVAPVIVFAITLFAKRIISKSQLAILGGCVVLSYVFAKATALLTYESGLRMATSYPVQFVTFDQLGNSLVQTLHSILIIFGAQPFGRSPFSGSAVSALLDLALAISIFVVAYRLWRQRKFNKDRTTALQQGWRLFFALVGMSVVVLYAFSTVADGVNTYRYFIILVLSGTLALALSLGSGLFTKRTRYAMSVILLLAIILNMGVAVRDTYVFPMPGAIGNNKNVVNFDLIQTIKANGLTKGYANYWQAGINTYLSHDSINFLPAYCSGSTVMKFHWLIAEDQFNQPAQRSFFIFDPTAPVAATSDCSQAQIVAQLGTPSKTLVIDGKTIYIFPYDISKKLP